MISSPAPSRIAANPVPVPACRTRAAHPWRASVASGQHKSHPRHRQPPEPHRHLSRPPPPRQSPWATRCSAAPVPAHRMLPGCRTIASTCHAPASANASVSASNVPSSVRTGRSTVVPRSVSRYLSCNSMHPPPPSGGRSTPRRPPAVFGPGRPGATRTRTLVSPLAPAPSTASGTSPLTCRAGSRSVRTPTSPEHSHRQHDLSHHQPPQRLRRPRPGHALAAASRGRVHPRFTPPSASNGVTSASLTTSSSPYSVFHSRSGSTTCSHALYTPVTTISPTATVATAENRAATSVKWIRC